MEDYLRRICPRDHLIKRNTQYGRRSNFVTRIWSWVKLYKRVQSCHTCESVIKEANQKWLMYSKILVLLTQGDSDEGKTIRMNQCFANRNEEDKIYPLTLKQCCTRYGLGLLLIENESCICHKEGWQPLQGRAVMGITTICSTLGIPVLKRQWNLQYTVKEWKNHPIQNEVMQDLPSE